mgnify:CR=1 FL=1
MAVVKIIELVGSSKTSTDDAAMQALKQAQSSLRNIRAIDVVSTGLRASAATPGFAPAACRLFDELEEERVTPQRWIAALRTWTEGEEGRRDYAEDLGRLYAGYRDRLERIGRPKSLAEFYGSTGWEQFRFREYAYP